MSPESAWDGSSTLDPVRADLGARIPPLPLDLLNDPLDSDNDEDATPRVDDRSAKSAGSSPG